jgi:hypothetical protein
MKGMRRAGRGLRRTRAYSPLSRACYRKPLAAVAQV